ncbi:MAG: hypothetical protein RLZZ292_2126 [Bacteroidota bacterium]|jgi:hypothetical protein
MSKFFGFKIIVSLIAISIIGIGMSCKNPMSDTVLELSTQPLLSVLNIQVVDADERTYTPIPDNAMVTLSGKDAAKIYALDGFKQLSIENGFISIGVLRKDTLGLANMPLEFMITVKANGYVDGRMNYRVATTNAQIATLRMINKDPSRIPPGVVIKETSFTVGIDTTTRTEVKLNTGTVNGRTEDAQVLLKQGTKLLDKDGKAVSGTVTATMVSFDATNPESLRSFPGGMNYGGSKDATTGADVGGGTFTTFGFMALSMSVGGTDIKSFSQPLEVSMELNSGIGRSDSTGSALQAGQKIPVWSLNETNGDWQIEGLAGVTTGANGKLKATFSQSHLSWWNLDDPTCWYLTWWLGNGQPGIFNALGCRSCGNPVMTIRSPNLTGNPDGGTRFYVEILNGLSSGNMVIHSYYDDLVNGANVYFTNYLGGAGTGVNENQVIRFKVYDRPGGTLLNPTTANTLYRPCNRANPIIDLSAMTIPPVPVTIVIDFSGLGACGVANTVIKPTTTFYYKDASLPNSAWLPWGLMIDGVASSSALLRGKTYYFGVFHSKLNFETTRMGVLVTGSPAGTIKIPATRDGQNIVINLDATTIKNAAWGLSGNIYLKPRAGTDIYDLTDVLTKTNMRKYTFNTYMCDKFKKYF